MLKTVFETSMKNPIAIYFLSYLTIRTDDIKNDKAFERKQKKSSIWLSQIKNTCTLKNMQYIAEKSGLRFSLF